MRYKLLSSKRVIIGFIIFGIIAVLFSYIIAGSTTVDNLKNEFNDVIGFVESQCLRFDSEVRSSKIKALMDISQNANGLNKYIVLNKSLPSEEILKGFIEDYSIDGVIITDSLNNAVLNVSDNNVLFGMWKEELSKKSVSDVIKYNKKVIVDTVQLNGRRFNYSAVARPDEPGLIVCYKIDNSPTVTESMAGFLTDYKIDNDGIVAITDGINVISSNDDKLASKRVKDCPQIVMFNKTEGNMVRVKSEDTFYYGSMRKSGKYYIYVFYPSPQVYSYRNMVVAYTICIYLVLCALIVLAKRKFENKRIKEIEEKNKINIAIGKIYDIYCLIYLDTLEYKVLKGTDSLMSALREKDTVYDYINIMIDSFIDDSYRSAALKFYDLETVSERLKRNAFLTKMFKGKGKKWYFNAIVANDVAKNGDILSVMITVRDVTAQTEADLEKKKKLIEANKSLKEYNSILDCLNNIYFSSFYVDLENDAFRAIFLAGWLVTKINTEGRFTDLREHFIKKASNEIYKEELSENLSVEHIRETLCREKTSEDKKSYFMDYSSVVNGKENWRRLTVILVDYNDEGKPKHVLIVLQDTTEQKNKEMQYQRQIIDAANEAEHANAAKTEFLRRMSHDIRTPINGILGMLNIAEHYSHDFEKQSECFEKIRNTSNHLLALINDVLDMSAMESGAITLEKTSFDLLKLIKEVSSVIDAQAQERGIELNTNVNITYNRVIGSALHLRQILINIAGNAVKYNKLNGFIELNYSQTQKNSQECELVFECKDTGIGMSEEVQTHMFEPFTQEGGDDSRTTFMGTGLGLSIVEKLVEKMDGKIEVKSVKGEGTEFKITLPLTIDQSREENKAKDNDIKELSLKGINVLLVEDNEINMEIAEFILKNEGANVTKAWNGKEAVKIFEDSPAYSFDVILMDVMMPVMDGITAAKKIRKLNREDARMVIIIAMTANAFSDDVERTLSAGMDEHLSKPVDANSISQTILKCLKRRFE